MFQPKRIVNPHGASSFRPPFRGEEPLGHRLAPVHAPKVVPDLVDPIARLAAARALDAPVLVAVRLVDVPSEPRVGAKFFVASGGNTWVTSRPEKWGKRN